MKNKIDMKMKKTAAQHRGMSITLLKNYYEGRAPFDQHSGCQYAANHRAFGELVSRVEPARDWPDKVMYEGKCGCFCENETPDALLRFHKAASGNHTSPGSGFSGSGGHALGVPARVGGVTGGGR